MFMFGEDLPSGYIYGNIVFKFEPGTNKFDTSFYDPSLKGNRISKEEIDKFLETVA